MSRRAGPSRSYACGSMPAPVLLPLAAVTFSKSHLSAIGCSAAASSTCSTVPLLPCMAPFGSKPCTIGVMSLDAKRKTHRMVCNGIFGGGAAAAGDLWGAPHAYHMTATICCAQCCEQLRHVAERHRVICNSCQCYFSIAGWPKLDSVLCQGPQELPVRCFSIVVSSVQRFLSQTFLPGICH